MTFKKERKVNAINIDDLEHAATYYVYMNMCILLNV